MTIVANPRQYKIPDWFLNRQRDIKDGRFTQITSSGLETKLRDDLERLKKIRWAGLVGEGLCFSRPSGSRMAHARTLRPRASARASPAAPGLPRAGRAAARLGMKSRK
jgi:hypothetical protein